MQKSCKKYTPPYIAYMFVPNTAHFLHFTPNPCHFWRRWQPLRWLTPLHVQGDCRGNTPGACEQHTFGVGGWLWAEFLQGKYTLLAIISHNFSSSHDLKYKIIVSLCFPRVCWKGILPRATSKHETTFRSHTTSVGKLAVKIVIASHSHSKHASHVSRTRPCLKQLLDVSSWFCLSTWQLRALMGDMMYTRLQSMRWWSLAKFKAHACCRYLMMF